MQSSLPRVGPTQHNHTGCVPSGRRVQWELVAGVMQISLPLRCRGGLESAPPNTTTQDVYHLAGECSGSWLLGLCKVLPTLSLRCRGGLESVPPTTLTQDVDHLGTCSTHLTFTPPCESKSHRSCSYQAQLSLPGTQTN